MAKFGHRSLASEYLLLYKLDLQLHTKGIASDADSPTRDT